MKNFPIFFFTICSLNLSYAAVTNPCGIEDELFANMPFFTGPLITPTASAIPVGHVDFEPYVYVISNYGAYDKNWNLKTGGHNLVVNAQFPLWVGLSSIIDINMTPQFYSKFNHGKSSTQFGDFIVGFDFQLTSGLPTNSIPGLKLSIQEVFPTGAFQNLDPTKNGADVGGGGLYETELGIVASRTITLGTCHFLSLRTALLYSFAPPSHVQGFHAYGGGIGANGKIKIGDQFTWLSAFEVNFNPHWVLACDLEFLYTKSSSFSGEIGKQSNGDPAIISLPESYLWSLAPAIEYNLNQNIGFIAGAWGSFAGKNSIAFLSGVLAINFYY